MKDVLRIEPIAYIKNNFKEKFGIPRQSFRCDSNVSYIIFEEKYRNPDAIRKIDGFSHLWLIFGFSGFFGKEWSPTVRPPRLGGNKRVGVFASRSPHRPNELGLSSVVLDSVLHDEKLGDILIVKGADLLDGTPIYDIKPYLSFTDSHPDSKNGYADEFVSHKLEVIFPGELKNGISDDDYSSLVECLSDDPRPSYIDDPERIFGMAFSNYDVRFKVDQNVLTVVEVTSK